MKRTPSRRSSTRKQVYARRRRLRLVGFVGALGVTAVLAFGSDLLPVAKSDALPIYASRISVIDGDTIRVAGERASVRLVDFNAPETRNAECSNERILGDQRDATSQ